MGSPVTVHAPEFSKLPFRVASDRADRSEASAAQIEKTLEAVQTQAEGWEAALAQLLEHKLWLDLEFEDDFDVERRLASLVLNLTTEQLAVVNSRACWNLNRQLTNAVFDAFQALSTEENSA